MNTSAKFKIGIWYYGNSSYSDGGAYAYTKVMQDLLLDNTFENIELVLLGFDLKGCKRENCLQLKPIHKILFLKILISFLIRIPFLGNKIADILKLKYNKSIIKKIKKEDIQLIFYLQPGVALDYPHIATVWDTGHISSYAFPEVSMHGKIESRLGNAVINLNKALLICSESQAGKRELQDFFGIADNRIEVIPLIPGEVITNRIIPEEIPEINGLKFFLYPAKYWPHKNHYNLFQGFSIFKETYPNVKLILTGFHQNNQEYIDYCIKETGLENAVIQLGVVNVEELKWLYINAIGLVMPTLLGPTNMPLMEAYFLNCKVACTDLKGHKEQLGDSALYFDALNPSDISDKLKLLYEQPEIMKINMSNDPYRDTFISLTSVFNKARAIRRTWGHFDDIS